ncbi:MAG TPA: cofactor-independent phosphoglycerate mutase [Planctomycetota bacterium]|nr:cofactor-independent phosphoglycerate mutase [Planctomycetota bacterium]
MKHIVICPDGGADWPVASLGNRTPLEAGNLPNLARLATEGTVGRAMHIPPGMDNGSDICCMSLLGFDPAKHHTGRAPLEAKSLDIDLGPDDIAIRCNTVAIEDGLMFDFTAGHIKTEESRQLIQEMEARYGRDGLHFHPGVSYRHLLVVRKPDGMKAACTPPHNITGKPVESYLPKGDDAQFLLDLMEKSKPIFADHAVNKARVKAGETPATQIWLWGHGPRPSLPLFKVSYGLSGAMISAVDLLRSLGLYLGLEVLNVPNITGYIDTDYAAKGRYAIDALDRHDLVFVHVEAPDECGHQGDAPNKVAALERIDADIVAPILASAHAQNGNLRILVCPDHPTPIALKAHATEPSPFVAWGPGFMPNGLRYNENQAKLSKIFVERGYELMGRFLKGELLGG